MEAPATFDPIYRDAPSPNTDLNADACRRLDPNYMPMPSSSRHPSGSASGAPSQRMNLNVPPEVLPWEAHTLERMETAAKARPRSGKKGDKGKGRTDDNTTFDEQCNDCITHDYTKGKKSGKATRALDVNPEDQEQFQDFSQRELNMDAWTTKTTLNVQQIRARHKANNTRIKNLKWMLLPQCAPNEMHWGRPNKELSKAASTIL